MNKTILIIEDDSEINNMLRLLLGSHGYTTISAYSGTEGLLVHSDKVDLILLDLMLPGKSGEEIIQELKRKHSVPVIVTSAIHDVNKKVDLFAMGADDYVTKPFHNEELLARIAARLRTGASETATSSKIMFKDIVLDKDLYSGACNGIDLELSRIEFDLLSFLLQNPNRTLTKSSINFQTDSHKISLVSNRNLLMRIFDNLIGNALKHGTGDLNIQVDSKAKSVILINKLAPTDSDIDVNHVFDEFYTTDISRTKGNTGLGLAIAKQFTEMLGGEIKASIEYTSEGEMFKIVVKL